jgi:hypothetical protein
VLLDHHAVEGRAQLVAAERGGARRGAQRQQLLVGIGHGDLRLLHGLLGLQVVLLGRDLFFPQLLLALVGGARQFEPPLRRLQRAALLREPRAGEHREHLPALDLLAQVGRHAVDHARHARHHVGRAVFVELDLAGQLQRGLDACGAGAFDGHAGGLDLLVGEGDLFFVFLVRLRFGLRFSGSALLPGFLGFLGLLFVVLLVAMALGLFMTVVMAMVLAFGLSFFVVLAVGMPFGFRMAGRLGLGRRGAQDECARREAHDQHGHDGHPLLLADALGEGLAFFLRVHDLWVSLSAHDGRRVQGFFAIGAEQAVELAGRAVRIGQRDEVLVPHLEQRALRIERFQKTELAQLEALGRGLVGGLGAGERIALQRLCGGARRAQALGGLRHVGAQLQLGGGEVVACFLLAAQCLGQIAAVGVEDRQRHREADDDLVAAAARRFRCRWTRARAWRRARR